MINVIYIATDLTYLTYMYLCRLYLCLRFCMYFSKKCMYQCMCTYLCLCLYLCLYLSSFLFRGYATMTISLRRPLRSTLAT